MFCGRVATLSKSLNNIEEQISEALPVQLARFLNLFRYPSEGLPTGKTDDRLIVEKETTMKTKMTAYGVSELTPEDASKTSGGLGTVVPISPGVGFGEPPCWPRFGDGGRFELNLR